MQSWSSRSWSSPTCEEAPVRHELAFFTKSFGCLFADGQKMDLTLIKLK
jgi:hypothetical protein